MSELRSKLDWPGHRVTALNPYLGYETSSALAKEALETHIGIYELVLKKQLLTKEALDEILKPENMLSPR